MLMYFVLFGLGILVGGVLVSGGISFKGLWDVPLRMTADPVKVARSRFGWTAGPKCYGPDPCHWALTIRSLVGSR